MNAERHLDPLLPIRISRVDPFPLEVWIKAAWLVLNRHRQDRLQSKAVELQRTRRTKPLRVHAKAELPEQDPKLLDLKMAN